MFGRKKEITQKFIENAKDNEENDNEKDESKKEIMETTLKSKDSDNFIFYGENSKFAKQIEIYAQLKDPKEKFQKDKLITIVVDSTSSIEYLSMKICENFSQFPEYQNLEGLRAINLTKLNDENNLPTEGKVEDFLRSGDIVYLDLISNDIWIKVIINMINVINKNTKIILSMDTKTKNELTFRTFRYQLMKSGIICFLDKCSKSENQLHYIISEINISTSAHGNVDENKLKTIDDMTIKQLFNFKSSLKMEIKFFPLEFILFQKLKILSIPREAHKNNSNWDKFKNLRFRELLNNRRYIKEKKFIFNFFKNLFTSKDSLPKCYVYSIEENNHSNSSSNIIEKNTEHNITNIENLDIDELDDRRPSQINKTIFNWSDIFGRSSDNMNITLGAENEKMSLILLPPPQEEKKEITINKNKKRRSKLRKGTDKDININFSDLEIGLISEDKDDQKSEGPKRKRKIDKRKTSDFIISSNCENMSKFISSKNLGFEILEKDDEMEDDNIYINLKPTKSKKHSNLKSNLCEYFEKYFNKERFLDFISEFYLINIEKGVLEKSVFPYFRKFKIEEKKIKNMNKRRKKKKSIDFSVIYKSIFSVKRLNMELGIFSIFVLGILIFFSYLLADTYY